MTEMISAREVLESAEERLSARLPGRFTFRMALEDSAGKPAENVPLIAANLRRLREVLDNLLKIEEQSPALVLLDVMMPKLDGFSVTQRVRAFSSVPIIMLSASGQDQDKIRGLDLGADDYLTKPFSIEELMVRVRAVLRRSQFTAQEVGHGVPGTQNIGDLTIDYTQCLVTVAGGEVPLTPIEYRILAYLAQNVGRVVTQDLLLEHVWGAEYLGESHIPRLPMPPISCDNTSFITCPWCGYPRVPGSGREGNSIF